MRRVQSEVRKTRVLGLLGIGIAFALTVGAVTASAGGGNADNAKLCQKGGSQNWVQEDGTPLANSGKCASYAAQGGTLTPPSPQLLCASFGGTFEAEGLDLTDSFPAPTYMVLWTCNGAALSDDQASVLSGACVGGGGEEFGWVPAVSATTCGLLSCQIVNTVTGSSHGSLESAQAAANPGDELLVRGTCTDGTLIAKDLTLTGEQTDIRGTPTLDGGEEGRVLTIASGVTVEINTLTITGGSATQGGGIYNSGMLTLHDSIVTGNATTGNGGGIYNNGNNGGTLILNGNSSSSGNTAIGPYDLNHGQGGGIHNSGGTVTLNDNSSVSGNTANSGGGISNYNRGTVAMNDSSSITGNHANTVGGGIYNNGGTLLNCVPGGNVNGNTALDGANIFEIL